MTELHTINSHIHLPLPLRKRILFLVMLLSLGILFLEGTARLFFPDETPEPVVPTSIGQWDATLGWSLMPDSHATSQRIGYDIEYRINSQGLRDVETPYHKPPGTFRIVLLGDSRTFGFGVPIDKHFTTLLEGYFNNVEVINMGIKGFGVDQQLLYLRKEGFRYEPDIVMAYVAHYGGHRHMHTRRFGRSKPRFLLVDGELVLNNCPVPAVNGTHDSGIVRRIHRSLCRHSRVYKGFRDGLAHLLSPQIAHASVQQECHSHKRLEDDTFTRRLHELGEAIVYAMHEESRQHKAQFVLVTQIEQLHEAARGKGMISVDVSRPLSNSGFLLPDNLLHINESGNGVLAWELARFLEANHLIPHAHLNTEYCGKLR